jgi:S1-C subfamily serine protease
MWLPLAFIHVLFCGVALGQDKSVSVETIQRAKYSAVPIVCLAKMPDDSVSFNGTVGSAFFINNEGFFVTASHVIDGLEARQQGGQGCLAPAIYLPVDGWDARQPTRNFKWFAFTDCLKNAEYDVAVCRPKGNPFQTPGIMKEVRFVTFAASSVYVDGTAVAFTGFPLSFVKPVTSKGYIASYLPSTKFIMVDKAAWPGASGCPLYLADGKVLGLITRAGRDEGSGLAYARPVELITDFLTKSKIAFHQQK